MRWDLKFICFFCFNFQVSHTTTAQTAFVHGRRDLVLLFFFARGPSNGLSMVLRKEEGEAPLPVQNWAPTRKPPLSSRKPFFICPFFRETADRRKEKKTRNEVVKSSLFRSCFSAVKQLALFELLRRCRICTRKYLRNLGPWRRRKTHTKKCAESRY